MPLIILGIVFGGGLAIYLIVAKLLLGDSTPEKKKHTNVTQAGNVIFLPKNLEEEKETRRKE